MKQKKIAAIPLLIAGIIMVLSFSIPHHHHATTICFATEHCTDENKDHCHHKHDRQDSHCVIKALSVANITRQHQAELTCNLELLPDFTPINPNITQWANDLILLAGNGLKIHHKVYQNRLHSWDGHATRISRAPPKR